MKLIVAETYRRAEIVANLARLTRPEWRHVGRAEQLRGHHKPEVLRATPWLGSWHDAHEIDRALAVVGAQVEMVRT